MFFHVGPLAPSNFFRAFYLHPALITTIRSEKKKKSFVLCNYFAKTYSNSVIRGHVRVVNIILLLFITTTTTCAGGNEPSGREMSRYTERLVFRRDTNRISGAVGGRELICGIFMLPFEIKKKNLYI